MKITTYRIAQVNAWFALFIILWGAWVRLSGSGAGCGEHWPLCNGEMVPLGYGLKTMIEYIHRLTSGIFGITIVVLVVSSFRNFIKGHPVRLCSVIALVLTLIEALVGAFLVKKGLVDQNASLLRAIIIAFHLANTLFLMASLLMCAYFSRQKKWKAQSLLNSEWYLFILVGVLFIAVSSIGAVTALGNTLFPDLSLMEGIIKDFSTSGHFLTRLRIYHPLVAVIMGAIFFILNIQLSEYKHLNSVCDYNHALVVIAIGFGVANWLMMAPAWGALLHLFIANMLWLGFVWLFSSRRWL